MNARHEAWLSAVNATDIDAYADVVTDDVVWIPPVGDAIVGRAAFRAWLEPFFEAYDYDFSVHAVRTCEAGGWIAESGRFTSRMTPRSGGPEATHGGAYLLLWRRDTDGRWRIERYVDTGALD